MFGYEFIMVDESIGSIKHNLLFIIYKYIVTNNIKWMN